MGHRLCGRCYIKDVLKLWTMVRASGVVRRGFCSLHTKARSGGKMALG